jgi:hypothetical protein
MKRAVRRRITQRTFLPERPEPSGTPAFIAATAHTPILHAARILQTTAIVKTKSFSFGWRTSRDNKRLARMILVFLGAPAHPQNGKRSLHIKAPELVVEPAGACPWIGQYASVRVPARGCGKESHFSFHSLNRILVRGDPIEPAMRIPTFILSKCHIPIRPFPCPRNAYRVPWRLNVLRDVQVVINLAQEPRLFFR